MAEDSSDLLMKFELSKGLMLRGETRTEISLNDDDMTVGFKPNQMFEVDSFKFRLGLGSEDEEGKAETKARQEAISLRARDQHISEKKAAKLLGFPRTQKSYAKWRDGTLDPTKGYPVDMQPVEFSRPVDKASSLLLQNCIRRVNYYSATLIKRKAAGSLASGLVFLRFDFKGVLMTKVEWDDDVPIKEDCQFICRAVQIHYKPQLPDGSLGGAVPAFWTMVPNEIKGFDLKSNTWS